MCGEKGSHLHEALLSRADIRNAKLQPLIMDPCNCVLVCPSCHIEAGSLKNTLTATRIILEREGKHAILRWAQRISKESKLPYFELKVKYYLTEAQNE